MRVAIVKDTAATNRLTWIIIAITIVLILLGGAAVFTAVWREEVRSWFP